MHNTAVAIDMPSVEADAGVQRTSSKAVEPPIRSAETGKCLGSIINVFEFADQFDNVEQDFFRTIKQGHVSTEGPSNVLDDGSGLRVKQEDSCSEDVLDEEKTA